MPAQEIYLFEDPVLFLAHVFETKKREDPDYSLREWARKLGLKNPGILSNVLKRQRKIPFVLAERFSQEFKLTPHEQAYFKAMVLRSSARTGEEREVHSEILTSLSPAVRCRSSLA